MIYCTVEIELWYLSRGVSPIDSKEVDTLDYLLKSQPKATFNHVNPITAYIMLATEILIRPISSLITLHPYNVDMYAV